MPVGAGRGGFSPHLNLTYDSAGGNGAFGFGWALDTPTITRKTDKGLPRYLDAEESDVFILSGAEDLVPVLDAQCLRKSLARTGFGIDYSIQFYRPRIEGAYARIERWTNNGSGVSHWRSISHDNVTTLFGFDDLSRVADPADPTRVFAWRISRSWDDKGNVVVYDYLREDGAGVDVTTAHEANRTVVGRATQTYLKSVRWVGDTPYLPDWNAANETPLPTRWMIQVVLDYGDHGVGPRPTRDQAWPTRPDPFSTWRPAFELRTYRRVQRILVFHDFPNEPTAGANLLVASLDLSYSDQVAVADPRNPIYTFLTSVTHTGYRRDGANTVVRNLPPLEFDYSAPVIGSDVLEIDRDSLGNLPEGIDGRDFRWLDLDGEGCPGILAPSEGGWWYKRNTGPDNLVPQSDGSTLARARFGPLEPVMSTPARRGLTEGQQFLDLAGEGHQDLVALAEPEAGFYRRTDDYDFEPLKRFSSLPQLDWTDPNLRFIDLSGDGLADVLLTEDGVFTVYEALGAAGFGKARFVHTPWDEERGPKLVLADGTDTVFIADMSGDGLNDLVRVRNGEACYWPNIGYGRFGPKVSMDRAPRFCAEEAFDPRRIRLADIDGSGSTDLLYVDGSGVRVWFNQSGNAWSEATTIGVFPSADPSSPVQVMDLLGTGTACLVWSSPLPGARAPLLYVDLMSGRKPHLMTAMRNNLGGETRVTYAPSTKFYVADAAAGRPWVTRLPFPVQVVVRREAIDWVGRNRHVARFAYHHGYFDGFEREFRGFGMVEQWDTDELRADTSFADGDAVDFDATSFSSPVRTRTWFHTGAFRQAADVSRQYAGHYWIEPALRPVDRTADRAAMTLPDTALPAGLDAFEMQEACRALKGHVLRVEVYSDDASSRACNPYRVAESNFTLTCLQRRGANRHAVFAVTPRETLTFEYERAADDPRASHELTLETDEYGNPVRTLSIGYPRRSGYAVSEPTLSSSFQSMLQYDQGRLHIRGTQHLYTNAIDDLSQWPDAYRTSTAAGADAAEITGADLKSKGTGITDLFTFQAADDIWQSVWSGTADVPYEQVPTADVDGQGVPAVKPTRRLVARSRTLFRSDALDALLPQGQIQPLAIAGQTYEAAFTATQIVGVFGVLLTDAQLAAVGYVQLAGEVDWWSPSTRVFLSPGASDSPSTEIAAARANFFLPRRAVDPFGGISYVDWDAYDLLPASARDAVDNIVTADNDYRVLAPMTVTDPNANRSTVAFDALGLVAATAVMGPEGGTLGDSLADVVPDLDTATLTAFFADPLSGGAALIGKATTRLVYDLDAYRRSVAAAAPPAPPAVATLARETRASDLPDGQTGPLQFGLCYSDGFGREIQKKARVADGPLVDGGPSISPRWLMSGWVVYDEKGRVARRYEPSFTVTSAFEFAVQTGVATTMLYDPPGRTIGTLHPDQTWTKTVFDPWCQTAWDANDTVLIDDPSQDTDVGDAFERALGGAVFTSWYATQIELGGAQQQAAKNAAAHADTPKTTHFDSLGRPCLVVDDCGGGQRFPTRTALDTEGKPLAVFDALGHRTEQYVLGTPVGAAPYLAGLDMAGKQIYWINADAGERRALADVSGQPVRSWDARAHAFSIDYDAARRPIRRWLSTGGAPAILVELTIWGEGQAVGANLAGRTFRHYDMAGFVESTAYDYAGNLASSRRQLGATWDGAPDWSALIGQTQGTALDAAAQDAGLVPKDDGGRDSFVQTTRWDALKRPVQSVTPHNATMMPNVLQPTYDAGAQLTAMDVWLQQTAVPTALLDAATADRHVITAIAYNPRGQRASIAFGNGVITGYTYDPETFRLTNLVTTRPAAAFGANLRVVQDLAYVYDPVGNITHIQDDADIQDVIFFDGERVDPSADYVYDPLYRLISATGREHLGQTGGIANAPQQVTNDDSSRINPPDPRNMQAMGNYTESYGYDAVGNFLAMSHATKSGGWTRRYAYAEPSRVLASEPGNRLSTTSLPSDPDPGPYTNKYTYNEHGSITSMPHLPTMTWDEDERLRSSARQIVNSGTPETTWYVYGADGQRVRKVSMGSAAGDSTPKRTAERLYLGGIEVWREFGVDGMTVDLSRETLHVEAGQRVAHVEVRATGVDRGLRQQVRYQHEDQLESTVLELGDKGSIISYEEFFPFGTTSYRAVESQTDVQKRYRFTGKERDQENDLYYHGVRYYAPWLGKWAACDPIGLGDGLNLYVYSGNSPVCRKDPTGSSSVMMTKGFDHGPTELGPYSGPTRRRGHGGHRTHGGLHGDPGHGGRTGHAGDHRRRGTGSGGGRSGQQRNSNVGPKSNGSTIDTSQEANFLRGVLLGAAKGFVTGFLIGGLAAASPVLAEAAVVVGVYLMIKGAVDWALGGFQVSAGGVGEFVGGLLSFGVGARLGGASVAAAKEIGSLGSNIAKSLDEGIASYGREIAESSRASEQPRVTVGPGDAPSASATPRQFQFGRSRLPGESAQDYGNYMHDQPFQDYLGHEFPGQSFNAPQGVGLTGPDLLEPPPSLNAEAGELKPIWQREYSHNAQVDRWSAGKYPQLNRQNVFRFYYDEAGRVFGGALQPEWSGFRKGRF